MESYPKFKRQGHSTGDILVLLRNEAVQNEGF